MLSIARLSTTVSRRVRTFTSTTRIQSFGLPSRPIKPLRYVQVFHKESPHAIWRLLNHLINPHRLALSSALFDYGLRVDEFKSWGNVVYESDIQIATNVLSERGFLINGQSNEAKRQCLPTWLILYLICTKVRTPAHAEGPMMDLVLSNIGSTPPDIQGPLLVITMVNLARFNLLLPMRRVVQEFLRIPLRDPALEFNLLLQAISTVPISTVESANQVVALLIAMEARQLKLRSDTYKHLLHDRFVNLQLTKYLRERMTREGFVPKAEHLELYLRFFAKNGLIHDAQQYFDALRADAISTGAPVPIVSQPAPGEPTGVPHSANVALVSAHGDRTSAFTYLAKLLDADQAQKPHKADHAVIKPALSALQTPRTQKHTRLPVKKSIDVYDWTAAFAVAANDSGTSWRALVRVFERVRKSNDPTFRPTLVTYTVLLRGLYKRKVFRVAEKYWWILLRSGLIVDSHALGIGLQVITRAGRPHEALAMLEAFASKATTTLPAPYKRYQPVNINIIEMNNLMVALNRLDRPDIVFKLWDHMYDLYGIKPNHLTLSILLQAVRIAYKLDDTLSGAVAQLAAKNPFRKRQPAPATRDEVLASFRRIAGDPQTGLRRYKSGIWDDRPPFEKARRIFLQVMFGESPEALRTAVSPARAVRQSEAHHPLSELARPFGLHSTTSKMLSLPDDLLTPSGHSHYPQIVPTNLNCFDYIALLGVCDRSAEIPLVLAWMRALKIQPTTATLSLSLAFWAEVSTQAPLIEQWSGGEEKGEYGRLVKWMEEWVGKGRMPSKGDMRKWGAVASKMRATPR